MLIVSSIDYQNSLDIQYCCRADFLAPDEAPADVRGPVHLERGKRGTAGG
jgi:hypothetical protein